MKKLLILSLLFGSTAAMADGKEIVETRCLDCHVIDGRGGERQAAPPMYAVWHHYRQAFPEEEQFVSAMTAWLVGEPSQYSSQMKSSIEKFGLMEKLSISEENARDVATYLYSQQFVLPEWYKKHYDRKFGSNASDSEKSENQEN
ncbi:MAG: cytochrome c [Chromatiales bacterium]|nr:cytochrome c [Chromatiales bacterium]